MKNVNNPCVIALFLMIFFSLSVLAGCIGHQNIPAPPAMQEPTASAPTDCEHAWVDATCTKPKMCTLCQITEGEARGHTEEMVAGQAATCTENGLTGGNKCTICGEITVEQEVVIASGHKDENNDFACDVCATALCKDHVEETIPDKAATCTEIGFTKGKKCSVCGHIIVAQWVIQALGHTPKADDGDVTTAITCVRCDYIFVEAEEETINLTISTSGKGAVTANKTSYKVGDTITLTVTPNAGYSQKLYINGKPLLLDWKTNIYSFQATDKVYSITGSFEPSLNTTPGEASKWDTTNQAHGILNTYYSSGDSSWLAINDGYESVSVKAKNYLPGDDGNGVNEFAVSLGFKLSNNKTYSFRVVKQDGKYYCQRFNISGDWTKRELDATAITAILDEGAEFKLERTTANTLTLSVDGKVYDTYVMNGVTADTTVTRVDIGHYGNHRVHVEIPFELGSKVSLVGNPFKTSEIEQYVIAYDADNPDYATFAKQLADQIFAKYGKRLTVVSDAIAAPAKYEILLGDTNRSNFQGSVMEYSVTVDEGKFRINVGGSCSAEKAITYLCDNVFNGQELTLYNGEYYKTSLLTNFSMVTSGATARVMTANVLADAFADSSYKNANYRAEIFAGMLVSYTPDVLGLQETDENWNKILDVYLARIQKTHGITYARHLATYEGKVNYTSLLYRADKFKVENSGVKVFGWWTDKAFNHSYHMRNISWAQFSSLENANKKFIVANTHWSYRTEHADGKTYLANSATPIAANQLREQCKNETNSFMSKLKQTYSGMPIFLTGDFNTSLPFFTQYGWTPTSFNIISEQAKNNGTAMSTVPTSGHFDHIFGTGSYTIKRYAFFNNINEHSALTDHPFAYVDIAF